MYDLKDIIGHENIKEYIHNSQKSGKIPHAFIFVGDKGCGKMLTAKTFAKIVQCKEDAYSACNKCRSCLQMESENQPDVIVVQKSKQNITIDELYIRPEMLKQITDAIEKGMLSSNPAALLDRDVFSPCPNG